MKNLYWILVAVTALFLTGCGGGGGGSTPPPSGDGSVTLNIDWLAQSRDVVGPSSALSAVINLKSGATVVATRTISRPAGAAEIPNDAHTLGPVPNGNYTLEILFYSVAAANISEDYLIASATKTVTIAANQTIDAGSFTLNKVIDYVEVTANQRLSAGQYVKLGFTAKTGGAGGQVVAVSWKSATWSSSNTGVLQIQSSGNLQGYARGVSAGTANVTVTVDGISSTATQVVVSNLSTTYQVTELTPLTNMSDISPYGINDAGDIVGYCYDDDGIRHAFVRWANGTIAEIPSIGEGQDGSGAYGINDGKMVAGFSDTGAGTPPENVVRAFTWQNGDTSVTALPAVATGFHGEATGINESRQVCGSYNASNDTHAVIWQNGVATSLGWLNSNDTYAIAWAINNNSIIVGEALHTTGDTHGFIWNGSMTRIGPIGDYLHLYTQAINDNNIAVGYMQDDNFKLEAFSYVSGTVTGLGRLPGQDVITSTAANGINTYGDIVGFAEFDSDPGDDMNLVQHAFIYHNGTMQDLNDLLANGTTGWVLQTALAINNRGQIIGFGEKDGVPTAYLITPVTTFSVGSEATIKPVIPVPSHKVTAVKRKLVGNSSQLKN